MRKFKFLPLLVLLIISSCDFENKSNQGSTFSSNLRLTFTQPFEIDSLSSFELFFFDIGNVDGEEYLWNVNVNNHSVDAYHLDSGKVIHRFAIPQDGPYAINNIQGIYFHNSDSIFLFPRMMLSNLALTDADGNFFDSFRVKIGIEDQTDMMINHASVPAAPTLLIEDNLYFTHISLGSAMTNFNFFDQISPEFRVNLQTDSLFWDTGLTFPKSYLENYWPNSFILHSKVENKNNELVYSWNAIDSLFVMDLETGGMEKKLAKSQWIKPFDFTSEPITKENDRKIPVTYGHYFRLIFDPYRELYYRFVWIPRDPIPQELFSANSIYKNKFSIMVLDEDLELLEEKVLEPEIYQPYLAFVGKKGLYLPRTNVFNPEISENEIKMDVFVFNRD